MLEKLVARPPLPLLAINTFKLNVWGQSLILEPALPSPKQLGWKEDDHNWHPHWTSLPTIAACCQELAKCGCKKQSCSVNCKCFKSGLACTALCSCTCQI